jgi:hypothetical protein
VSKLTKRGSGFCVLLIALFMSAVMAAPAPSMAKGTWDHVANIKDSAKRLAILHLREGSPGVLKFLDACYRTQMLSSEFTAGLESCMAQDYMHSQVLAKIYAKIPQADRVRMGVPAPEDIANGMGQRFVAAFAQYKISVKEAAAFKKLVDKDGLPIFVNAVFPPHKTGQEDDGPAKRDAR